jgi:hypothetical protein
LQKIKNTKRRIRKIKIKNKRKGHIAKQKEKKQDEKKGEEYFSNNMVASVL